MSEFKIHHHAAELLKILRITDGDGPEVYAEMLTRDLTPYVTTQISSHTAKRKIAEASEKPQEFLKKYEELKSKNIRELDSLVFLLSSISQERHIVKFLERNERDQSRARLDAATAKKSESTSSAITKGVDALTDSITKSKPMSNTEFQELKSRLANITTATSTAAQQMNTDDIIKSLREKRAKTAGSSGLPVLPSWTMERPYLTQDFVEAHRATLTEAVAVGSLPLKMQEIAIIEDLLFLFMGIEGKYITLKDGGDTTQVRQFSSDRTLDVSFQEMINRITPLCTNYSTVCRFIEDGARFEKGLVCHGLCSAMRSLLKDYLVFVAQLERQFRKGYLTLQKLWFYIQPSMKMMEILSSITISIVKGNCRGAAILTLLHERIEAYVGDSKGRDMCLYLTQACCAQYFELLQLWIYNGIIKDPYAEFLVAEHDSVQKESVAEDFNDAYWEQHYTIERERIPVFLEKVAEKILRTGKYLNVIRQCDINIDCPYATEIIYCLNERDYVEHIEKAYEYASAKLLELLITDKKLLGRLKSIKHYFLLDQGDFFVAFMDLAEAELKKKSDEITVSRLEALLELALRTSTANDDQFKDDLRCHLLPYDLITQLLHIHSITHDKTASHQDMTAMQITGLESFTLDYIVKWPLSLIISKKALTQYQILFRHLFYAKHVERQLCNIWVSSKEAKKSPLHKKSWYSRAFTLRQRMIHFVQNFEYYCTFEVIEPYWHVLEQNLKSVKNIDGVLDFHNDFLAQCLKDCMLSNPDLLKIVSKLMATCVMFGNCMTKFNRSADLDGGSSVGIKVIDPAQSVNLSASQHLAMEHLDEMMSSEDIEKLINKVDSDFTRMLVELLDKLTDEEHQMMSLVSRIDHNNYYSETQRQRLQVAE